MSSPGLDTVVPAETPEGIVVELRPAGLTARGYALLIDWILRLMVMNVAMIPLSVMGGLGGAGALILYFALEWFYPVAFELSPSGATPGKRIFGLRVVMDDGLPVTLAAALTRNLLRVADFLPFFFGAAIVSMLLRHDGKRLGDLAARTLVVYRQPAARKPVLGEIRPLPPVIPLSPRDQAAVISLAARAPRLTSGRLDELAALAAVVSGDQGHRGPAVTQRVLGVAAWLLGHRA